MVALQEEQAEQHSSLTIGLSGLRTPSRASGGTQPIGVGNIADWGRICRQYIARVRTRWAKGTAMGGRGRCPDAVTSERADMSTRSRAAPCIIASPNASDTHKYCSPSPHTFISYLSFPSTATSTPHSRPPTPPHRTPQ